MNNPNDSHVEIHAGDTSFVGPDAVNLYRAITLKSALTMYAKHKMLTTRGLTATMMLSMAHEYTGHPYKRGDHQKAADDLVIWIETMKAAMPITKDGKQC